MKLPREITAGGRTRRLTEHFRNAPRPGITATRVQQVLDNWLIRGIYTDSRGTRSWGYLAFVTGLDKMVNVAVSLDDERIVTAFLDRTATGHWNRGNRDYFEMRYENLEIRNENQTQS